MNEPPSQLGITLALALLLVAVACQPPPLDEEAPLETVEVGLGPTATLVPDADPVEEGGSADLAGGLPTGFPPDLPVFRPANVSDFGPAGDRASFVVLTTDRAPTEVRRSLERALSRSPWRSDGEPLRRTKGNLRAHYQVTPGPRGGSLIRIEYGLS